MTSHAACLPCRSDYSVTLHVTGGNATDRSRPGGSRAFGSAHPPFARPRPCRSMQHGAEDDQPQRDLPRVQGDVELVHEVGDDPDDRGADQGAADAALTAEQAGAADHHDGDRVELHRLARLGQPGGDPRDEDQGSERGAQAADRVDREQHPAGADPGQARGLEVVPDGVDPPAERRVVQQERRPRRRARASARTASARRDGLPASSQAMVRAPWSRRRSACRRRRSSRRRGRSPSSPAS